MKTTEVLDAINALLAAKWPSVCGPHRLRTALLTLDDALGGHDAVAWYRLAQETKEAMELAGPGAGSRKPLSEADEKTP